LHRIANGIRGDETIPDLRTQEADGALIHLGDQAAEPWRILNNSIGRYRPPIAPTQKSAQRYPVLPAINVWQPHRSVFYVKTKARLAHGHEPTGQLLGFWERSM
jgi:hypothetical protein